MARALFHRCTGRIRGHHFGEGKYDETEQASRELLTSAGNTDLPPAGTEAAAATGVQAPADDAHDQSNETYLGYRRAEGFLDSDGLAHDRNFRYSAPFNLGQNRWALDGQWSDDPEKATLVAAGGKIVYRFSARDLHLVLGPGTAGSPVRFRVLLDGKSPGADHGSDTDADGYGVVKDQRLYQLIRQTRGVDEHVFSIEFMDAGVQAYAFTFG